jgi:hypothetical protein
MINTFMAPSFHSRSHAHVKAARAAKHATPSSNMPSHIQGSFPVQSVKSICCSLSYPLFVKGGQGGISQGVAV